MLGVEFEIPSCSFLSTQSTFHVLQQVVNPGSLGFKKIKATLFSIMDLVVNLREKAYMQEYYVIRFEKWY